MSKLTRYFNLMAIRRASILLTSQLVTMELSKNTSWGKEISGKVTHSPLSLVLNITATEMNIKYHPRCSSSKLTHLCFGDDLLIFIDESLDFVLNVLQVLQKFKHRSGLAVSVQKSSFFASGLSMEDIDTIKAYAWMPNASLPVMYLGVPLCTKKLSPTNCEVFLDSQDFILLSSSTPH
ncbi:hypothetical protein F2Q70_00038921 [Brassica cretica]|uniref:Reverse transcriptase domain-containing protein n=1 Tax=Brassica cretica TaxID=69181 RepID=A0A8S9K6D5_BRACR|nr:hypothetical protein F2Q70_00038921 [Brassica cretica]